MKNKTKLKLLLSMMLLATTSIAQDSFKEEQKRAARAKNFADFLLYWSDWDAYLDVSIIDKKLAERETYDEAKTRIPELVQDSTYYADEIVKSASIINKRYPLNKQPDMAYFLYEIKDIYKDKKSDRNSDEYKLGRTLAEYERVLKELKLARYTLRINQK